MAYHDHPHDHDQSPRSLLTSRMAIVLIGFLAIAGALLFTEHRAHVLGVLIYVPILLCVFMHMFMHGGHGGHGSSEQQEHEKRSAS
jgi:hypothetical protein